MWGWTLLKSSACQMRRCEGIVGTNECSSSHPGQRIIINLSPAEQKKSGPIYDFPMEEKELQKLHA
ncbi:magnesium chelatase domain-containing protein [Neobacillus massiliamazoniensis]|uniref:Uncharacterized protein n=1 Tax=Neobacillus massiliamazoniensis TaxID=1499688 RepID=A0A0U1NTG4_9BACI|nr:magnesium chelatase domain-containing protein [Neobacillus massiliamazoniensis]CRK81351.1 hypothetical protein BN000_01252 [Neobacillus massiliamazoniensis]